MYVHIYNIHASYILYKKYINLIFLLYFKLGQREWGTGRNEVDIKNEETIEEVDEEESEYETETDTDHEPIEANVTVEPVKEETDKNTDEIPIETSTKEETSTAKDPQENEDKNPAKKVQIDEDMNDEKTYR